MVFQAKGHDGIALWGSVGTSKGEDANATEVVQYLDDEWADYISKHCKSTPAQALTREKTDDDAPATDVAVAGQVLAAFRFVSTLRLPEAVSLIIGSIKRRNAF